MAAAATNIMSAALPVVLSRFERYSMPAAEEKLSDLLGLAWDQQMQDWDLTNANPELLPSLFVLLQQQELSDDEQFSAMALAVASVDDLFMADGFAQREWAQLERLLLDAPELHASTIWYWAGPALRNEEPFPVSSAMAALWRRVEPCLMSNPSLQRTAVPPDEL